MSQAFGATPERSVRLTLILGMLTAFAPMSIDMYLPAFPEIARDLGTGPGPVQLTLATFLIGISMAQAAYGPLADRFGRRRPLVVGCVIFVVASIGCASSRSVESLIAWRFIMALGGAAGMVITRAIVRDLFEERESARLYSLLMLIMGVAPILAPLVGGQVLLIAGWRAIFMVLAAFGLTCLAAVSWGVPETLPVQKRQRIGMTAIFQGYGNLLGNSRFIWFAIACGFAAGVNFSYITGAPFVFIGLHHISPQQFGLFFGTNACGLIAASQLNRRLLRDFRPETLLASATVLTAGASALLVVATGTGWGGFPAQIVLIFFSIASLGLIFPNAVAVAMAPFGSVAGTASALLGTVQFSLASLAGAMVGLWQNGTALPMATLIAVCGAGAMLAVRRGVKGSDAAF